MRSTPSVMRSGRLVAVREACARRPATRSVREEPAPRDEGDAFTLRRTREGGGVGAVEVDPDEVPACGMTPRRAGRGMFLQRAEHRVSTLPQLRADTHEVRFEAAAGDELVDDRLRQKRRRDVGRDGPLLERRRLRLGQHEVPAADTGRDRLRERRRVRDELPALELAKARLGLALEADEPVRVVLENRELVLARRSRRGAHGVRPTASSRSGSETSGSCTGTTAARSGCAAPRRVRPDRDLPRPSRARRPRPRLVRGS